MTVKQKPKTISNNKVQQSKPKTQGPKEPTIIPNDRDQKLKMHKGKKTKSKTSWVA